MLVIEDSASYKVTKHLVATTSTGKTIECSTAQAGRDLLRDFQFIRRL